MSTKLSILVIDDDEMCFQVVRMYLESYGLSLDWASNGHLGVKAVKEGQYDVVFMDIMMPEMDGYEATAEIRKTGPDQPYIVALTAVENENADKFCQEHQFDAYIPKPIRKSTLDSLVGKLSARKPLQEERLVQG